MGGYDVRGTGRGEFAVIVPILVVEVKVELQFSEKGIKEL
jgi:hypothetical protein